MPPPPVDVDRLHSVKVDNVPSDLREEELREVFSEFGKIGDIYIPRNRHGPGNKGYAFVRYYEERDAEDAVARMDGQLFAGREVKAQLAKYTRPERRPRRGGYDRGGYDRGYDRGGYERGGYDRGGYDRGYDRGGYDRGYDRGYERDYDRRDRDDYYDRDRRDRAYDRRPDDYDDRNRARRSPSPRNGDAPLRGAPRDEAPRDPSPRE